jgi:hypothetical protein
VGSERVTPPYGLNEVRLDRVGLADHSGATYRLLVQPPNLLAYASFISITPVLGILSCFSLLLRALVSALPMPVICENVVSRLYGRGAREPALGVVPLRRLASQGAGSERIGCSVIVEHGLSPPAAVREPLAVLHHEIDIMLGAWHRRCRERLQLFRVPMDLCHLGPSGNGLPLAGMPGLVGLDHHRISNDHKSVILLIFAMRKFGECNAYIPANTSSTKLGAAENSNAEQNANRATSS